MTESTLERMLAIFDVTPLGPDRFAGQSDARGLGGRPVVEGSQILAQAMVAAGQGPDETGPPVLDAWLRYDTVPGRDDLRRAQDAMIRALAGPAASVPSASRL